MWAIKFLVLHKDTANSRTGGGELGDYGLCSPSKQLSQAWRGIPYSSPRDYFTVHSPVTEVLLCVGGQIRGKDVVFRVGRVFAETMLSLGREEHQPAAIQVEPCGADEGTAVTQGARTGCDRAGHRWGWRWPRGGDAAPGEKGEIFWGEKGPAEEKSQDEEEL